MDKSDDVSEMTDKTVKRSIKLGYKLCEKGCDLETILDFLDADKEKRADVLDKIEAEV